MTLLGSLRIALDDTIIADGVGGKPWALLAYLVVEADRPHARERLAALLWPDQPEANARQNLRWALSSIRRMIGDASAAPPFLLVNRESIQFNCASQATVDLLSFRRLLADPANHQALMQAVDLYRGDLLDGLVSVSEPFEEWLRQARIIVQQQLVHALAALLSHAEQMADAPLLERYARRWLQNEPWNEIAHRAVMRALLWQDRRGMAIQQYESCRQLLAQDVGVPPEAATEALYAQIRQVVALPSAAARSGAETLSIAEDTDRQRMIARVEHFWIHGVRHASQRDGTKLTLPLQVSPGAGHPIPAFAPRDDTQILDAYDAYGGDLLILGAPGAGKTSLLLDLAQQLLTRARQDADHPIPVIFNLAFWNAPAMRMSEWFIRELQLRYQVPQHLAHTWVTHNHILPLLDSFDEIAPELSSSCLEAIRTFRRERWMGGMVLCCRNGTAAQVQDLVPRGIVELQLLSSAQIESYFARTNLPTTLQKLLLQDSHWHTFAITPLALSLIHTAANELMAISETAQSLSQHQLFAGYFQAMLERAGSHTTAAERERQRRWLCWLAAGMQRHRITIFTLEGLQPSWLPRKHDQVLFLLIEHVILGVFFGLIAGLDEGIRLVLSVAGRSVFDGLWVGLLAGLLVGVFSGLLSVPMVPVAERFPRLAQGTQLGVLAGLTYGLTAGWIFTPLIGWSVGLVIGMIFFVLVFVLWRQHFNRPIGLVSWSWQLMRQRAYGGIFIGLIGGLVFGLIDGSGVGAAVALGLMVPIVLVSGITQGNLRTQVRPNEGIYRSIRIALIASGLLGVGVSLVFALSVGLLSGLPQRVNERLSYRLDTMMDIGVVNGIGPGLIALAIGLIFFGGLPWLQHGILRLLLWRADVAPLNLVAFLNQASDLMLLHQVGGGYFFRHQLLQEHCAAESQERETL